MELSLVEIWQSMGVLARGVAIFLVVMGVASLAVCAERLLVLRRAFARSAQFAVEVRTYLEDGDRDGALALAYQKRFAGCPLARLTAFGLETYAASRGAKGGLGPVEATRRELARRLELLSAEARRGMGIVASTGSTAPFIGLFGTVIGIITAFQGIAASGGGGLGAVSAGIAEALIVTAVGLFVAITSVLLFNYLTAAFERLDMRMQHAASELVDNLEGTDEGSIR